MGVPINRPGSVYQEWMKFPKCSWYPPRSDLPLFLTKELLIATVDVIRLDMV